MSLQRRLANLERRLNLAMVCPTCGLAIDGTPRATGVPRVGLDLGDGVAREIGTETPLPPPAPPCPTRGLEVEPVRVLLVCPPQERDEGDAEPAA